MNYKISYRTLLLTAGILIFQSTPFLKAAKADPAVIKFQFKVAGDKVREAGKSTSNPPVLLIKKFAESNDNNALISLLKKFDTILAGLTNEVFGNNQLPTVLDKSSVPIGLMDYYYNKFAITCNYCIFTPFYKAYSTKEVPPAVAQSALPVFEKFLKIYNQFENINPEKFSPEKVKYEYDNKPDSFGNDRLAIYNALNQKLGIK